MLPQNTRKRPGPAACVAPKNFDFYFGQYYLEHSELPDDEVPLVMPEHLVNAPVSCNKLHIIARAGYHDRFHVVKLTQLKENKRVLAAWTERFADRNLREESQLSGRRITDRPGDEASRRNLLVRGSTL